jgi:hypothetical protein
VKIKKKIRQEAVDLAIERVLMLTRLRNMAAHWDGIVKSEARSYGITKTADKYGLEVSTVRTVLSRHES